VTPENETALKALFALLDISKGGPESEALLKRVRDRCKANDALDFAELLEELPLFVKSLAEARDGQ
jgi:hypothetical protein